MYTYVCLLIIKVFGNWFTSTVEISLQADITLSGGFYVVVVLVVVKRNKTGITKYPSFYIYIPKNIL